MNSKLTLHLLLLFLFSLDLSKSTNTEIEWAKKWALSPESSRSSLLGGINEVLDVKLCESRPEPPKESLNLLNSFRSATFSGWKASTLTSQFSSKLGLNILQTENLVGIKDGPDLKLPKLPKGQYRFSVWVKLGKNGKNSLKESLFNAALRFPGEKLSQGRVIASGLVKVNCWAKVKGGFNLNSLTAGTIRLAGTAGGVSLELTSLSLVAVQEEVYRREKQELISQIRKRDVNLRVRYRNGTAVKAYVRVSQTKSDFPWGGSISGAFLVSQHYRSWFSKLFSWSVFENEAKWYATEVLPGDHLYDVPDLMLQSLQELNISVRGHTVLWNIPGFNTWTKNLSPSQVVDAVRNRVRDVVSRYKGRFLHWDVVNEMLHGSYFEEATGDPNFAAKIYALVKEIDPKVLTFVNDYNVIEQPFDPSSTPEVYIRQIKNIEANGGPVDGIGLQGHFTDAFAEYVKVNLDQLSTLGKTVWVTELDVYLINGDTEGQAEVYERVLWELFSHPAVDGIVGWGVGVPNCTATEWRYLGSVYCEEKCIKCLVDMDFQVRPMGKRYLRLRKEWSTRRNSWLNNGLLKFRGFFGTYKAELTLNGVQVEKTFRVPKGSGSINVNILV